MILCLLRAPRTHMHDYPIKQPAIRRYTWVTLPVCLPTRLPAPWRVLASARANCADRTYFSDYKNYAVCGHHQALCSSVCDLVPVKKVFVEFSWKGHKSYLQKIPENWRGEDYTYRRKWIIICNFSFIRLRAWVSL